ncbi:winged helix domain-containing protein [Mesorhizobium australicum]|uniref:winged helix domain-containing protein n=1 Tax=Mesorhizobium australicum TaxID=536018 RepID=UPI003EB71A78
MQDISGGSAFVNSRIDDANKKFAVIVRKTAKGSARAEVLSFAGREAWALRELIRAGEAGCRPIDNPAPRWSRYVWLHRDTFEIAKACLQAALIRARSH